jgi:hypothetical protein
MVMGNEMAQAQRLDTRERTRQLRLSKRQMDKADVDLKRSVASAPGSNVTRQIEKVNRRIVFLQMEVVKYDSSSPQLPIVQSELYKNKNILADLQKRDNTPQPIKGQITYQYQRWQKYANVYDSIVYDASKNPDKYTGLNRGELAELLRYNFIRRNNLIYDLEKDELFQAVANGDSNLDWQHKRLRGVVLNEYSLPVTFWFEALDGGRDEYISVENKSSISKAKGWATVWLIEGLYRVHVLDGQREIDAPFCLRASPRKTSIEVSEPVNPYADYWTFRTTRRECYFYAFARNSF